MGHNASHYDFGADCRHGLRCLRRARRAPGKRVRAAFAGEKAKDDPFAKVRIAEAASDIDAAWRQLIGNVSDEYALLAAGKEIPFELRARARRDQVRATGRSIASIDRLFERPVPPRCPMRLRFNGSGATRTPVGCTPPTTPSGHT